jgi:DNA-binding MarR family transcriptional regulator
VWSPEDLADLPAWTLIQAYHAVAQRFRAIFAEHRLTPVQFGVLAQLSTTPTLTQSELARRILIRPQSMGELIATLVERGLLVRQGPGGRGRRVPVALTPDGQELLTRASASVRAFNEPPALGISAREAATLNVLLHKLILAQGGSP